jgi:hypothetical protein
MINRHAQILTRNTTRGQIGGQVYNNWTETSASSSLDFGVEAFQFRAGVFDAELPVDTALLGVGLVRPCRDFGLQFSQFTDTASAEALACQAAQFAFGDNQPVAVFRCVAEVGSWRSAFLHDPCRASRASRQGLPLPANRRWASAKYGAKASFTKGRWFLPPSKVKRRTRHPCVGLRGTKWQRLSRSVEWRSFALLLVF